MHDATDPNQGTIELVVCRYNARPGAPINPAPPRYENYASSGPWSMGECKWVGGCVVVLWARRTLAPLQPLAMLDQVPPLPPPSPGTPPPAYVDNVGPAPVVTPSGAVPFDPAARDTLLLSGRMQHPLVTTGRAIAEPGQAPPNAPPIAMLPRNYHLPSYARPAVPPTSQRNVTERSAISYPVSPATGPAMLQPQPSAPAPGVQIAGAGLLASAEVRPFGGPLPPSPLDYSPPQESSINTSIGAVPVVPAGLTPVRPIDPPQPAAPNAANVAVAQHSVTDRMGYTETAQTAPPRLTSPPIHPNTSPPDRSLQPLPPPPERIEPHIEQPEAATP